MTPKQRYFKKVYDNAPMIPCACGCGTMIKSKDKYARDVRFVNGHNNRKYTDPTQYKREWNHRNRTQRQAYKVERLRKLKAELIHALGSKCSHCGIEYDGTNAPIFDFHHIDPSTMECRLSVGILNKVSRKKAIAEAKKCMLLCSNCHRLHHSEEY